MSPGWCSCGVGWYSRDDRGRAQCSVGCPNPQGPGARRLIYKENARRERELDRLEAEAEAEAVAVAIAEAEAVTRRDVTKSRSAIQ